MSKIPYFEWNGQRSTAMGIVVREYPPITRPNERVSQVTIPGRSGTLTRTENDIPVYSAYVRSIECYMLPDADQEAVFSWLEGSGDLIFGNEPDRVYKSRVSAPIELRKIVRGRKHRSFTLSFTVQPVKYMFPAPATVEFTTTGGTLVNPGNHPAHPLVRVEGSGDITLMVAGQMVNIHALSGGVVLDWGAMILTDLDGALLPYGKVEGGPQRLFPGVNGIHWTGSVTKVVITPRWAYL